MTKLELKAVENLHAGDRVAIDGKTGGLAKAAPSDTWDRIVGMAHEDIAKGELASLDLAHGRITKAAP